jgi:hypothetical protein
MLTRSAGRRACERVAVVEATPASIARDLINRRIRILLAGGTNSTCQTPHRYRIRTRQPSVSA